MSHREDLTGRYLSEVSRSFQRKDYPRAQLCAERLAQLEGQSEESSFRLAQALDAQGDTGRTQTILDRIAPLDHMGHAPAHLWQAQKLLKKAPVASPATRDALRHLEYAVTARPNLTEARALLGQIYAFSGDLSNAESNLVLVVDSRPDLLIMLAQINAARGETTTSRKRAERARDLFQELTGKHPEDADSRLRWTAALIFLENFAQAEAVLQEGLTRSNNSPIYHQALARVYLDWADWLEKQKPDQESDRTKSDRLSAQLTLLERGLRHDPSSAGLLDRLAGLILGSDAEAGQVREALKGILAKGQATATVHFLLGLDAWQNNRAEEARLHWERSHELAPEFLGVTNNLAWVVSTGPKADPQRALDLINLAIDQSSGEFKARLRGTRGHVLIQMKRWKEALADLESDLPFEAGNADVQSDLAAVYTALGLPDQAAEHRRLATEFNAKKKEPQPSAR
jgi:tetratricopeptide (TPR) repeat protein